MIDRRLFTNFDWGLLFLVLLIAGIGVVNIASATASYTLAETSYPVRQVYWILIGLFLVVLVCSIDYHLFEDLAYWMYGIVAVLLLAVLVMGKSTMGATRWLNLGFVSFQPSELMKIVIIMVYARYFNNIMATGGMTVKDLLYPFLLLAAPSFMIMKQPDLGTAILVVLIAFSMILFVGIRIRTVASLLLAAVPAVFLGWRFYLRDYQKERVLNFLSP